MSEISAERLSYSYSYNRFLSDNCLLFGDFVQKHFKVMSRGDSVILDSYDANLQLR